MMSAGCLSELWFNMKSSVAGVWYVSRVEESKSIWLYKTISVHCGLTSPTRSCLEELLGFQNGDIPQE